MDRVLVLAVFSLALPACAAEIRNLYSEAQYLGATTFLSYCNRAGLTKVLKDPRENLTVLAPTNVAFTLLPPGLLTRLTSDLPFLKQLLRFHLARGLLHTYTDNRLLPTLSAYRARVNVYGQPNMTTVSGSPVLLDHNPASNGEVIVVRKVMYPLPTDTALHLVSGDNFDMLLLALTKAGVTSLFNMSDTTVLAPSNEAFQSLPPGVFSDLLDNVPLLTKVLQTHVIKEVVYSAYLVARGGAVLESLNGQQLNVTVSGKNSTVKIGAATVTSPDQSVTNGVVHVIDKVLLPAELLPTSHTPLSSPLY